MTRIWTGQNVFTIVVGAAGLLMVVLSFDLAEKVRQFPITTGILLFVLSAVTVAGNVFPNHRYFAFLNQGGVFESSKGIEAVAKVMEPVDEEEDEEANWRVVYLGFLAMAGFAAILYYTSYLVATPIFIVASIVYISKGKLVPALWIALGVEVFMYVIFDLVLSLG